MSENSIAPVRKSVVVNTSVEEAFRIFTDDFDSWWPRGHHIGPLPLKRAVIERGVGGRCYGEQEDGSTCPWGTVTTWDPPHRFVFAWQITPQWEYQPNLDLSSEVEVRFTPEGDQTRVELEHRNFEKHGAGGETMRAGVGADTGWGDLLRQYAERVAQ